MNDLMIDLETLGTTPSSPIIAIGAVFFDRNTGETGKSIELDIEFNSACEGREICPNTIKWWLVQSDAARGNIVRGNITMNQALANLSEFIGELSEIVMPWGNGATFDISMLEDCYRQHGLSLPWRFWNVRDCRTIECVSGIDKWSFEREGVHHGALDDAKHQVKYISAAIRFMAGEK